MKNLVYLLALTILAACGNDNNTSGQSFVPNNNQTPNQVAEQPSELEQLTTASEGTRGACLPLDFSRLDCSESLTSLEDESLPKASYAVPVSYSEDRAMYELTSLELSDPEIEEMEKSVMSSKGEYADYLLYRAVTRKSDKFFYFINSISGANGIDASGEVRNFSAEVQDSTIPVSYVVDCADNGTTFHLITGRYGIKMTYRQADSSRDRYEVTLSGLSRGGDRVVNHTSYCTLSDVDQVENSVEGAVEDAANEVQETVEDAANEAEETVEDAANEAEETAGEVEEGLEGAADAIDEAAEDTEQAVEEAADDAGAALDSATEDVQSEAQEAKEAVGNAVKQTGEAIEEGLDKTGDSIESGIADAQKAAQDIGEKIDDEVGEAGDATTEAIADGVVAVDRTLKEGAAVVEGTAEAIAEKAEEMGEDIDKEIDEARAENNNDVEEEGGFVEWLRDLFR